MVRSFRFPGYVRSELPGCGRGEEPSGGNALHLIQDRLSGAEFCENRACLSSKLASRAERRSTFQKYPAMETQEWTVADAVTRSHSAVRRATSWTTAERSRL